MIKTATLERVMHLAGAVRGQDHNRRFGGMDRAKLRNRHLKIRKRLQQKRLEGLVGAVDLVNKQHRRAARLRPHRLQERALDQIILGEKLILQMSAIYAA